MITLREYQSRLLTLRRGWRKTREMLVSTAPDSGPHAEALAKKYQRQLAFIRLEITLWKQTYPQYSGIQMTSEETLMYEQAMRRLKLIQYLRRLLETEPERFDLRSWASAATPKELERARQEWPERAAKGEPLNCGTSACVVGHLPVIFPDDFTWTNTDEDRSVPHVALKNPHEQPMVDAHYLIYWFGGKVSDWARIIYPPHYHGDDCEPSKSRFAQPNVKLSAVIRRIVELDAQLLSAYPTHAVDE